MKNLLDRISRCDAIDIMLVYLVAVVISILSVLMFGLFDGAILYSLQTINAINKEINILNIYKIHIAWCLLISISLLIIFNITFTVLLITTKLKKRY